MFKKVYVDEVGEISSYLDKQLTMVSSSVSEGNTEGQIWTYDEKTYFLWDKGNVVFYIFGERPSPRCLDDLPSFFNEEIRKDAQKEGFSHLKIDDRSGILDVNVESVFGGIDYITSKKYFYEYKKKGISDFKSDMANLKILDINERFLKNTDLENLTLVINEVKWMWPSFKKFFENGFGKAGVVGDEIACWCTAEYVSEGMCGIGIETSDNYRRKGIATLTAAEFLRYCLMKSKTPFWECDASNAASVRLAEKLGFDKISENMVMLGKF